MTEMIPREESKSIKDVSMLLKALNDYDRIIKGFVVNNKLSIWAKTLV